ncbi:hypothetical protein Tco_0595763 [Tanacetum coccineum]
MIDELEKDLQQTKKIYSTALTKLVLRVKKLEYKLKSGKAKRKAKIEEEVHEKPSDETKVIIEEETPTKIIEECGSGEKGKIEISTASPPKVTKLSMDEELSRKMEEEERARFNAEQEARALQEEKEKRLNLEAAWELQKQLDER